MKFFGILSVALAMMMAAMVSAQMPGVPSVPGAPVPDANSIPGTPAVPGASAVPTGAGK